MSEPDVRVLVVDDERALCAGIREALQREGYRVDAVHDGAAALAQLGERPYNVIISDVRMPQLDGSRKWSLVRTQDLEKAREFIEYYERRKRQDSDLWVIELDVADGERFIGLGATNG